VAIPVVTGDVGAHRDEGESDDHQQAWPRLQLVESGEEQMCHVPLF
jgi:hypothetical protein